MKKIPPAIDFWLLHQDEFSYEEMMIKFTELHVKAALEAAAEQAIAKEDPADYGTGEIWVDKRSILDSYPLINIK